MPTSPSRSADENKNPANNRFVSCVHGCSRHCEYACSLLNMYKYCIFSRHSHSRDEFTGVQDPQGDGEVGAIDPTVSCAAGFGRDAIV